MGFNSAFKGLRAEKDQFQKASLHKMYFKKEIRQRIISSSRTATTSSTTAATSTITKYLQLNFFYLNINQLDALNFIMSLFNAFTCFEHKRSSSGGQNCTIRSLVSSHI